MAILFDSSTLISLATTCGLTYLPQLQKIYGSDFAITNTVKAETIGKSMETLRFKYEGIRLNNLIGQNVLKLYEEKGHAQKIDMLMTSINSSFFAEGKPLKIVHPGEISVLVLGKISNADALAIDERTTRLVIENPEMLRDMLQSKLHTDVKINKDNLAFVSDFCKGMQVIRSAELAFAAWKSGLLGINSKDALEGVLWALKFAGCAISQDEINTYINKFA
ncbi:MAG: hypothetical protein AABX75_03120 [Nanoarchaeota archaeon]